ncbi:regulator of microtubule dynamics protein 1 [Galendromus occidentalis]|uniref:Regulator of microtubule dynamics protein 1 n=1 Tax=Galendromus occidentalis TaxID=34638 RepID=A0AAJ6QNT3_9ACAR|nr:regulator of microtubule dynamics protein 1 [Galendromus occidentalis]
MWASSRGAFRLGVQLPRWTRASLRATELHRQLATATRTQHRYREFIRPDAVFALAFGATMADAIRKCDTLYEAGDYDEAYAEIMKAQDDPSPEVRWRIVRMTFKVAEKTGEAAAKTKAINEGIVALEENLKLAPNCPNTHKWIAILLASKDQHDSLKHKIEEAFIIREHLEKALHYNPKDGYAHYVLGRWCFQVASVGWIQRKAAAALFASPPESSYEQALEHFMRAETLNPDIFNACFLMAAKCFLQKGDKDKAGEYLKKCIEKKGKDQESIRNIEEAQMLAKKHKLF